MLHFPHSPTLIPQTSSANLLFVILLMFFVYYCITVGSSWFERVFNLEQNQEKIRFFQSLFSVTAAIPNMFHGFDSHFVVSLWLWLPDVLFSLSPSLCQPTDNYCFASRAMSCSECLQAGKGCAYCPDEVRTENKRNIKERDSNLSVLRWMFIHILSLGWLLGTLPFRNKVVKIL